MFGNNSTRWMAGAVFALGMVANLAGTGAAAAQSLTALPTAQLLVDGGSTVAAGVVLTVKGTSYKSDEMVSFWINVPEGTTIPDKSLGQADSAVDGAVIPLDAMASTDENGAFAYTMDTTGLPGGDYSLVAHGLTSGKEEVFSFKVDGSVPVPAALTAGGDTAVAAGTMLTIHSSAYEADEPVGFWINVPDGTSIPGESLGQTDTAIDGTVIPLDKVVWADEYGVFTYTLDTSGLPSGNYSLVAHGMNSKIDNVLAFTIK